MRELFDVAVLAGVRNPATIGFISDEVQRVISIDGLKSRLDIPAVPRQRDPVGSSRSDVPWVASATRLQVL